MSLSVEWWDATARDELLYRGCPTCESSTMIPRLHCEKCGAEMAWRAACGIGTVFAVTRVERSTVTAAGVAAPYHVAYVQLDEGPLFLCSLLADASIGDRVKVSFVAVDDLRVPVFGAPTDREPRPSPRS